jgi:hypothetical protein
MTELPERKIKISPDVLFQEVSGETVLLDLESEHYFGLDAVGTRIWGLIGEGVSVDAMVIHCCRNTRSNARHWRPTWRNCSPGWPRPG